MSDQWRGSREDGTIIPQIFCPKNSASNVGAKDRAPGARTQHGFLCSELQHFSKPSTLERGVPLRERKQQTRWGCNRSWSWDLTIPSHYTLNLKSTLRFDWYTECCTYLMAKPWWVFPLKSKCQMWDKVVTLKINCLRAWGCGSVGIFLPGLPSAFKDLCLLQYSKNN